MIAPMTSTSHEAQQQGQTGRTFETIGVIGLGTMGAGIAEVFARNGFAVIGVEVNDGALHRGREHLEHSTGRAVARGKISEADQTEILGRITLSTDIGALADADLVVEAVVESLEVKAGIFRALDDVVAPDAILATNTSSLSVTEISTANARPGRVIGIHFFNPAPVQNLVEIVRTVVTEPSVLADVETLVGRLGKNPVVCGDKAGFIANTLLFGYLNHAVSMYEAKYASREDIDAAMRLGCRYPMGPLALLDLIGLDTAYEILDTMYKQGRDRLHAPAPILKQMVVAGLLGRKSGHGFYTYAGPDTHQVVPDERTPSVDDLPELRREIRTVGVVGTGTMASGIAEVFAKAGYDVMYVGRSADRVDAVHAAIERSLDKAIQRGKMPEEEKAGVLHRLTGTTSLDDLRVADLVVEAIAENLAAKTTLFANLDDICRPGTILATTTSSLPVIALATVTKRPQDVVGMHFFNPAPVMRLVEVVSTVATADDVAETVRALCDRVGKVAVSCGDRAGFIVNALLFPYLNDAVKMLQAHYATADDIDTAMKQGCALPMGPFELLDVVGNDVSLAIQRELYLEFREPGFAPAPLLEHLVTAGYLGRKTKRGFRDYSLR
jgi:3-hydroxybutyryl-CoA dehydrogenase